MNRELYKPTGLKRLYDKAIKNIKESNLHPNLKALKIGKMK